MAVFSALKNKAKKAVAKKAPAKKAVANKEGHLVGKKGELEKIISEIQANKVSHKLDFRLKTKTEAFTQLLFCTLFDTNVSVPDHLEKLKNSPNFAPKPSKGEKSFFEKMKDFFN